MYCCPWGYAPGRPCSAAGRGAPGSDGQAGGPTGGPAVGGSCCAPKSCSTHCSWSSSSGSRGRPERKLAQEEEPDPSPCRFRPDVVGATEPSAATACTVALRLGIRGALLPLSLLSAYACGGSGGGAEFVLERRREGDRKGRAHGGLGAGRRPLSGRQRRVEAGGGMPLTTFSWPATAGKRDGQLCSLLDLRCPNSESTHHQNRIETPKPIDKMVLPYLYCLGKGPKTGKPRNDSERPKQNSALLRSLFGAPSCSSSTSSLIKTTEFCHQARDASGPRGGYVAPPPGPPASPAPVHHMRSSPQPSLMRPACACGGARCGVRRRQAPGFPREM